MNRVLLFIVIVSTFVSTCKILENYQKKQTLKGYEREMKTLYDESMLYYRFMEFETALKGFRRLLVRDRNNPNINYYIALCQFYMRTPSHQIIPFLEKAVVKVNPNFSYSYKDNSAPIDALLTLGEMYMYNYRFDEAQQMFEQYRQHLTNRSRDAYNVFEVENYLRYLKNARELIERPVRAQVELFRIVQSEYSEYTPYITRDGRHLFFASDRKGATGGTYLPDRYKSDIYVLSKNKEGRWLRPKKYGFNVNTSSHEYMGSIASDGTFVFVREDKREKDYNIYELRRNNKGRYMSPALLNENINTKYNETSVCISVNGKYLIFASDKPGGYGGKDLYMSERLPSGEWGRPINLGPTINTPYDEDYPFLWDDGVTLYFSSKGHNSMGGYDIFVATLNEDGTWSEPENLGYPINTTSDDTGFCLTEGGKIGYYSTARNAHKSAVLNCRDIYEIRF